MLVKITEIKEELLPIFRAEQTAVRLPRLLISSDLHAFICTRSERVETRIEEAFSRVIRKKVYGDVGSVLRSIYLRTVAIVQVVSLKKGGSTGRGGLICECEYKTPCETTIDTRTRLVYYPDIRFYQRDYNATI